MPGLRRLRGARGRPGVHARARASRPSGSCSCPASAAPAASPTTWTRTGCTASTAARPALATGLAAARDDLSIWVVTGDGDALSIGGNHLIHALRRNVPVKILLFNNQIYGLTKGQASPTSELGKVTKSTPFGSIDPPFNPVVAGARRRGDVRRAHDRHATSSTCRAMLRAAAEHEGAALVEIYQNCPVFNDGAFDALTDKDAAAVNRIPLVARPADPLRRRARARRRARRRRRAGGRRRSPRSARTRSSSTTPHRDDPSLAFALSRLASSSGGPTPIGIFRSVARENTFTALHASSRRPAPASATRSSPRCCTRPTPGRSAADAARRCRGERRREGFRRTSTPSAREDPRVRARGRRDRPTPPRPRRRPCRRAPRPRRAADVRGRLLRRRDRGGAVRSRDRDRLRDAPARRPGVQLGAARARRRRDRHRGRARPSLRADRARASTASLALASTSAARRSAPGNGRTS